MVAGLKRSRATRLERPERPFRRLVPGRPLKWMLPHATFAVKSVTVILTGATVTLLLWRGSDPGALHSSEPDRFSAAFAPFIQQSSFPRNELPWPQRPAVDGDSNATKDRFSAAFAPFIQRRNRAVMFTQPGRDTLPQAANGGLTGKPLRYLIGAPSAEPGRDDAVTVVSYDAKPVKRGVSIGYCNLFDETNSGAYGPYLQPSDTAAQYNEGQIDPLGPGWTKNLHEQFQRRRKQGSSMSSLTMRTATRSRT